MGLDIFLYDGDKSIEKVPSDKYPDHICNKTHLRSSYNESGFNRVVSNLTGREWYWVFEPQDEYIVRPDWVQARKRAVQLAEDMRVAPPYRVTCISQNVFLDPSNVTGEEALEYFLDELNKSKEMKDGFYSYSNAKGNFFMKEPLEICAAIPGRSVLGEPATYLVYKADISHYIQSAEITIELIDFAQTLVDPVLHWSG